MGWWDQSNYTNPKKGERQKRARETGWAGRGPLLLL